MGEDNSLEAYASIYYNLVLDIADCYPSNSVELDLMKIRSRVAAEGISFLTKSLPSYRKNLDRLLCSPEGSTLQLPGLERRPGTAIPKLFGFLLEKILTETGEVRSDACPLAIKHYRTACDYLYKLSLPYDQQTSQGVIDSFVQTEAELQSLALPVEDVVLTCARLTIARILSGFNVRDIIPKHGPGAVSTGENTAQKSVFKRIFGQLDREYPFTEYFMLGVSQVADQLDYIQGLDDSQEPTAKVVLVPKDSRGPRLISCEPLEIQYIQQGLRTSLYDLIEGHYITRGHVSFRDQSINQRLALKGSTTGRWATLDMKDASDRVSMQLVERLFADLPILTALRATRSSATRLPDGQIVQLCKYAPMGSALCFPIEALTFYALCTAVLRVHGGLTSRQASKLTFVYGDDIIVPSKYAQLVLQHLPKYGLKFNENKCCVSGLFRESCGVDAYRGVDVTPIRLRNTWSRSHGDARQLASYTTHGNALYEAGYWRAAEVIRRMVERQYGALPILDDPLVWIERDRGSLEEDAFGFAYITRPTALIGWRRPHVCAISHARANKRYRINRDLQRPEVFGYVVRPKHINALGDGWNECLRALTGGSTPGVSLTLPLKKGKHTEPRRYAVARRSCLKRAWGLL
jgi:hypothetical protein